MASGTGNLPHVGMSFSPFAILTAEEQNQLVANIESIATGVGVGDGAIKPINIVDGFVQGAIIPATYYPSGDTATMTITFTKPFATVPKVSVTPVPRSVGGSNFGEIYTAGINTITTNTMIVSCRTGFSGAVAAQVSWMAIGTPA